MSFRCSIKELTSLSTGLHNIYLALGYYGITRYITVQLLVKASSFRRVGEEFHKLSSSVSNLNVKFSVTSLLFGAS